MLFRSHVNVLLVMQVERAHLEGKVNENIDTLARGTKAIDGDVPATPDDLQVRKSQAGVGRHG